MTVRAYMIVDSEESVMRVIMKYNAFSRYSYSLLYKVC